MYLQHFPFLPDLPKGLYLSLTPFPSLSLQLPYTDSVYCCPVASLLFSSAAVWESVGCWLHYQCPACLVMEYSKTYVSEEAWRRLIISGSRLAWTSSLRPYCHSGALFVRPWSFHECQPICAVLRSGIYVVVLLEKQFNCNSSGRGTLVRCRELISVLSASYTTLLPCVS